MCVFVYVCGCGCVWVGVGVGGCEREIERGTSRMRQRNIETDSC